MAGAGESTITVGWGVDREEGGPSLVTGGCLTGGGVEEE